MDVLNNASNVILIELIKGKWITKLIFYTRSGIKYSASYDISALLCITYNTLRVLVGVLDSRSPT